MALEHCNLLVLAVWLALIDVDSVVVGPDSEHGAVTVVLDRLAPLRWVADLVLDVVQLDACLAVCGLFNALHLSDRDVSVVVPNSQMVQVVVVGQGS